MPPSAPDAAPLCERRPWDSGFFGIPIAQIASPRPGARGIETAVRWADEASIACVYFLADVDDSEGREAAEANGFEAVGARLTLERAVPPGDEAGADRTRVRPARHEDVDALMAIARVSHRNTRFHRDRHFDPARSDELYAVWIERSVAGALADAVWVADADGMASGYLAASRGPGSASIGLVAVAAALRGQGYGDQLLKAALRWAADAGLGAISVVTQGDSPDAVRFYERAGFGPSRVQVWYHRWLAAR